MKEGIPKQQTAESAEDQAQRKLDELLADPSNQFLTLNEKNNEVIENAQSAAEALAYAREQIQKRLEGSTVFRPTAFIEGLKMGEVSIEGLNNAVEAVWRNAQQIGIGGDAVVVIFKNEIRALPPEICYKFATAEKTKRGRNPISEELDLHEEFCEVARASDSKIGVPMPFYGLEISDKKLIAMEKLQAKSVDDILHGNGYLPDWIDIDELCEELRSLLDTFHQRNLYHRDMHIGNFMVTQKQAYEPGDKLGYVIDFGLSGKAEIEDYAYTKEVAGDTFTYKDDYGIIQKVSRALENYRARTRSV
jgi:tRNA A-37 threonylcarbamoyl transferase component Bud32